MRYKGLHLRGGRLIATMMGAFLLIIAHPALAEEQSESSAGDVNYIVNGDFSEATIPDNGGNYGGGANITVPSWEFGTTAGLAKGNSAWIRTTHSDPYAAYMQRELKTTYIQQTFTLPVAGRYRFSFYYKARDMAASATGYQLAVSMDGDEFKSVTTASTSWRLATVDIELNEGVHVLKFYAKSQLEEQSLDISVIIDDVSLRKITASDNLIANGDFSDSTIPSTSQGGGYWGVGSANASAQSWEIGNSSGLTTANSVWRNPLYSEPYSALLHHETENSTLSQQVWVPAAGRYAFSFWYTARNGYGVGYKMDVSIDDTVIADVTTTTWDWQQCKKYIDLPAGVHTLKFFSESQTGTADITIILDDVVLEAASDVQSAVWTGKGNLDNVFGDAANWQCYDEMGNLLEGKVPDAQTSEVTLAADADWRSVPAGELSMTSLILSGHDLKIAGNGTLPGIITVISGENCVKNGDFTTAANLTQDNGAWGYGGMATAEPWVLGSQSGITAANNSPWTTKVFTSPYSAYVQAENLDTSWLSQQITVPADGLYRFSLWYVGRDRHATAVGHKLAVSLDDVCFTAVTTTTCNVWTYYATDVELKAGIRELKLYGESKYESGVSQPDRSVIIDEIALLPSAVSRFTVEVPEGMTFDNSRLRLQGNVELVKAGAGTLTASATPQTYTGGTQVEAGVLRLNVAGSKHPLGPANDQSAIHVAPGATLDLNGQWDMNRYHVILDGGTLANSGGDMPSGADYLSGKYSVHQMTLTADSRLDSPRNFLFHGDSGKAIDLGGHTLTAKMADGKTLFLRNQVRNGKLLFDTPEAVFYVVEPALSLPDADFDINGKLAVAAPLCVRDWIFRRAGEAGLSDSTVTVDGVFSPVSDYFCDTQLADGATLDLSGRDTALDIKSLDTANEKDYRLSFADNATIFVYFGERRMRSEVKVVAWAAATKPANLATLRFKVSPKNRYRQRLVVKEDGIYAEPADGMMIIVR